MKTTPYLIFFLLLLFVLAACSETTLSEKSSSSATFGELVSSRLGAETNFVNTDGVRLHVKVLTMEDSRCPSDVICVWEGMVVVRFQIAELKALYSLCLGSVGGCEKEIKFVYEEKEYTLELIDVKPYPSTTNSTEEKIVEFKIRR